MFHACDSIAIGTNAYIIIIINIINIFIIINNIFIIIIIIIIIFIIIIIITNIIIFGLFQTIRVKKPIYSGVCM